MSYKINIQIIIIMIFIIDKALNFFEYNKSL